tara:strand:+ start:396 stop:632 length:237 start_codon:yes stop_codon:yes gene_type:complete
VIQSFNSYLKGLNTNKSEGSKVKTEIIANNIAIPVNIPKYIVGIKLDNTRIEKPKTIVIEVLRIALPTVLWQSFKVLL